MLKLPDSLLQPSDRPMRILNVCGGHELSLNRSGLRNVIPSSLQLIPGPGCPVCVCPEDLLKQAMDIALRPGHRIITFADMLRVPVSQRFNGARSLEEVRARGGRVHGIASPQELAAICEAHSEDTCVFLVVGFETTLAPVAAMLRQIDSTNLKVLCGARRTLPVVLHMLSRKDTPAFDGIIAPGHVCSIMGANEWQEVVDLFRLPVAVSGFETQQLVQALNTLIKQIETHTPSLTNCYREAGRSGRKQR